MTQISRRPPPGNAAACTVAVSVGWSSVPEDRHLLR
jgi:hypothetical protein